MRSQIAKALFVFCAAVLLSLPLQFAYSAVPEVSAEVSAEAGWMAVPRPVPQEWAAEAGSDADELALMSQQAFAAALRARSAYFSDLGINVAVLPEPSASLQQGGGTTGASSGIDFRVFG